MPISLSEFKSKRGKLETIDYGDGDSISFRWRPDRLDDDLFEALSEASESKNPMEANKRVICAVVTEWDVTDQGMPYPITPENVGALGIFIQMDIIKRINAGVDESITKKGLSGGSSTPASPTPIALTGTGQ